MTTNSTAFLTDKYEVTMLQAAMHSGAAFKPTAFELFARKLPSGRRYGVVGGVARAIEAVRDFRFTEEQLAYLGEDPLIQTETVDFLRDYRFTGKIYGYADGDLYFPYSPILTVEGTFADSVLLETVLLSILNHDSAIASAATRMVTAADGRFGLIEMGSRRTHESAAVATARAAYISGFDSTSNLEAGLRYGIPTTGTSAHAFTLAHPTEIEGFRAQVEALGKSTTLLVDTYNIKQGIWNAVEAAGPELGGIRIDSGDLVKETFAARALLDDLGAKNTRIVLSSDIDEYSIDEMVKADAPVDCVGAGTRVATGSGHPTAGMVYKLVEIDGRPVAKRALGKISVGGRKKAWRKYDSHGVITGEFFTTGDLPEGANSLQHVFVEDGEFFIPTIEQARKLHATVMDTLPEDAKLVADGDAFFTATLVED